MRRNPSRWLIFGAVLIVLFIGGNATAAMPTSRDVELPSFTLSAAATSEDAMSSTDAGNEESAAMPSLIQTLPDYSGDLWNRAYATGDWGGARTDLAEKGILFEIGLTQILQGNAHGGADTNNGLRYSGSVDYEIKLDTARMGLWPAGLLYLKGETQFGKSINRKVGSLMAANADALFPVPDDPGITTLSDVVYTQGLSEKLAIMFGKIDFRGGDSNVFAHDETTQFMNLALVANPTLLRYCPYSALMAGAVYMPTDWLTALFVAMDSFGTPTTSGFDTAFHSPEGTTFLNEWGFKIEPFGLEGNQRVGLVFSTRDYGLLDQDPRFGGPIAYLRAFRGILNDPEVRPDDWAFYYNFDQYLYTEAEDKTQGIGLFGRFGWSSGEINPVDEFYSIGLAGKGVIPERDHDTCGLGYYYLNGSDDLPSFAEITVEQGVELYYSIEITPWLHVTPDLQVIIDPGGTSANDVAIVYGLRTQMSF